MDILNFKVPRKFKDDGINITEYSEAIHNVHAPFNTLTPPSFQLYICYRSLEAEGV